MIGGSPGGDAYDDAASGSHRGPGSPAPGVRSDAVEQIERATGTARLWLAVVLLVLLVASVLFALL